MDASERHTFPEDSSSSAILAENEAHWLRAQQCAKHHMDSFKKDGSELGVVLASIESSLGGLRQEMDAVKQLNAQAGSSRGGTLHGGQSPFSAFNSKAGSLAMQQVIDPLAHGIARRFSSLAARQQLEFSDAGSRRSSLGNRYLPAANETFPGHLDSLTAATNSLQDRIYAAIERALQTAATSAANSRSGGSGDALLSSDSDAQAAGGLAGAVGDYSVQPSPARFSKGVTGHVAETQRDTVAFSQEATAVQNAAVQDGKAAALAAVERADAAERLAQQLLRRLESLEQQVELLRNTTASSISEAAAQAASQTQAVQQQTQQLHEQQEALQQQLQGCLQEAARHASHVKQLSGQFDELKMELQTEQQLQQDNRQQLDHCTQELLQQRQSHDQLVQQVQQQQQQMMVQDAHISQDDRIQQIQEDLQQVQDQCNKQESLVGLIVQDSQDQMMNRFEGLQLRLQSLEEEQESVVEQQKQNSQDIIALQQLVQDLQKHQRQQQPSTNQMNAVDICMEPAQYNKEAPSPKSALRAAAVAAAAFAAEGFPSVVLPDSGFMAPTTDADELTCTPASGSYNSYTNEANEQQQQQLSMPFMLPDCASMKQTTGEISRNSSNISTEQQRLPCMPQLPGTASMRPSSACEGFAGSRAASSDDRRSMNVSASAGSTCSLQPELESAVLQNEVHQLEHRLKVLEQQAEDVQPLDGLTVGAVEARLAVLEEYYVEQQKNMTDLEPQQQRQQQDSAVNIQQLQSEVSSLAARIEAVEQQQMQYPNQSGEASSTMLDAQPTVKSRIEQFEEQLNAAISRFAPGHSGSSKSMTACGATAEAQAGSHSRAESEEQQVMQQQLSKLQHEVAQLQAQLTALTASQQQPLRQYEFKQQLQDLEAQLKRSNAELAEQVLQLDLQLQTVDEKVKRQHQQLQEAARTADEADVRSKAAAEQLQEIREHLQEHIQQQMAPALHEISAATATAMQQLQADVQAAKVLAEAADSHAKSTVESQQQMQQLLASALEAAALTTSTAKVVEQLQRDVDAAMAAQQLAETADVRSRSTADQVQQMQQQVAAALETADVTASTAQAVQQLQADVQIVLRCQSIAEAADARSRSTVEQLQDMQQQLTAARITAAAFEHLQAEVQTAVQASASAEAMAANVAEGLEELHHEVQRAVAAASEATAAAEHSKQVAQAIEQLQQGVQLAVAAARAAEAAAAAAANNTTAEHAAANAQQAGSSAAQPQELSLEVQQLSDVVPLPSATDLQQAVSNAQSAAAAAEAAAKQSMEATEALEALARKVQHSLKEPAAAANAADTAVELRIMVNKLGAETAVATEQAAAAVSAVDKLRTEMQKALADAMLLMHETLSASAEHKMGTDSCQPSKLQDDVQSWIQSNSIIQELQAQVAQLQLEVDSFTSVASDAAQQSRDLAEHLPQLRSDVQEALAAAKQGQVAADTVTHLLEMDSNAAAKQALQQADQANAAVTALQERLQKAEKHSTDTAAAVAKLQEELQQASEAATAAMTAAKSAQHQQEHPEKVLAAAAEGQQLQQEVKQAAAAAWEAVEAVACLPEMQQAAAAAGQQVAEALQEICSLKHQVELMTQTASHAAESVGSFEQLQQQVQQLTASAASLEHLQQQVLQLKQQQTADVADLQVALRDVTSSIADVSVEVQQQGASCTASIVQLQQDLHANMQAIRKQEGDNVAKLRCDLQQMEADLKSCREGSALQQQLADQICMMRQQLADMASAVAQAESMTAAVADLQRHVDKLLDDVNTSASTSSSLAQLEEMQQYQQQQLVELQEQHEKLSACIGAQTNTSVTDQQQQQQLQLGALQEQLDKLSVSFGAAEVSSLAAQQQKHQQEQQQQQLEELQQQMKKLVVTIDAVTTSSSAEQQQKQQQQLDEMSQLLFELRVEMQTGLDEPRQRLEDLEILEASRKSAAARTEAAAADALEKVESLLGMVIANPASKDDLSAQLQHLMQQLQQQDAKSAQQAQSVSTDMQHVQQELQQTRSELQNLQEQQQQTSMQAQQQLAAIQQQLRQLEEQNNSSQAMHQVAEVQQQVQHLQLVDGERQEALKLLQQEVTAQHAELEKAVADAAAALQEASVATDQAKGLRDDLEAALAAIGPCSPAPSSLSSPGPTPGFSTQILTHQSLPNLSASMLSAGYRGSVTQRRMLLQQDGGGEQTPCSEGRCQIASPPVNRSLGMLFTPQASPGAASSAAVSGAADESPTAVLAARLQRNESQHSRGISGLRHTYSSNSGRGYMRASIDSLGSPSFKEAAAAASTYDTYQVSAVEANSVWMQNEAAGAEDAADCQGVSGPVDHDSLQQSTSVRNSAGIPFTALAGVSSSSIVACGSFTAPSNAIADSAVFENSLFDNEQVDDVQDLLVAPGNLRLSAGTLGCAALTPRVSDSVMLRSLARSSQQGFAAAVAAADADAASDIAAAVAAASPLAQVTPLSVYRNATYEEDGDKTAAVPVRCRDDSRANSCRHSDAAADGLSSIFVPAAAAEAPWAMTAAAGGQPPATPLTPQTAAVVSTPSLAAAAFTAGGEEQDKDTPVLGGTAAAAAAAVQDSDPVPQLALAAVGTHADDAADGCMRRRSGPGSTLGCAGTYATAAVAAAGVQLGHGRGDSPSKGGDLSPAASPEPFSRQSSVWSSPTAGAYGSPQQQHSNMPPPSPGLSMAELSIGGPIDLDGSDADSDLLTHRTDCTSTTYVNAGTVAVDAAATAVAVVQWQKQAAQAQGVIGSLTVGDYSTDDASNVAESESASEDEYSEVCTATLGPCTVQVDASVGSYNEHEQTGSQQQQFQQWQAPQMHAGTLDGGVSWLMSSDECEEQEAQHQLQQQAVQQQQQCVHGDAAANWDEHIDLQDEDSGELPVLRLTGGAGYEPYDSDDDDCGSEYDYEDGCSAGLDAGQQLSLADSDSAGSVLPEASTASSVQILAAETLAAAEAVSSSVSSKVGSGGSQPGKLLESAGATADNSISSLAEIEQQPKLIKAVQESDLNMANWSIAAGSRVHANIGHASTACSDGAELSSSSSIDTDADPLELEPADSADVGWLHEVPPSSWLTEPGSFRVALRTSSKPGAGTRTAVSG